MRWNWEQPDWPAFTWRRDALGALEDAFLLGAGRFAGRLGHLDIVARTDLTADALSAEALTTSAIEGDILDRASVQSSIRRHLGLPTDRRRVGAAEQGIADMMIDLQRRYAGVLADETLFHWHRLLTKQRGDLQAIGAYRTHAEPMQIVSGGLNEPVVHFEAPPSMNVPTEMAGFIDWFNRTAPDQPDRLPALTRAGIAHFYFVCVHPFEDGNGRIARALAEKALAQGIGRPTLMALAATILKKRRAYYEVLERSSSTNELTEWLTWFAAAVIEAQNDAQAMVAFLIDKTRLLDRLRGHLNVRQEKVLLRMLREGPEGFAGGLSARNYVAITGASTATATRDLADMVTKEVFARSGERRYARYWVRFPLLV